MHKRILLYLASTLFICTVSVVSVFAFKGRIINECGDASQADGSRADGTQTDASRADGSQKYDKAGKKAYFLICIDIKVKTLYLFRDSECIKDYPIAAGKPESPSPLGVWKIIDKGTWGEGFGGRWMGLNVPWGTYGIHGTLFPESIGGSVSHGCIRMFNEDIRDLYSKVPVGTAVVIENGPFGPFGTGFYDIRIGDRGADVLEVQRKLKILGYYKGDLTGVYYDDMKFAIHKFQKEHKLPVDNTVSSDDFKAMGFEAIE